MDVQMISMKCLSSVLLLKHAMSSYVYVAFPVNQQILADDHTIVDY